MTKWIYFMFGNNIRKRLFVIISGILIIGISIYAYNITSTRQKVLEKGRLINAKITKITHGKGNIKSFLVNINGKDYSAGEIFGDYHENRLGDTISVYFMASSKYVVLKDKKTYINTLVFEWFTMILGGFFIVVGLFYNEKKKMKK